jgi:hypothetical protein
LHETRWRGTEEYIHQLGEPAAEEIVSLHDTAVLLGGNLRGTWYLAPEGDRRGEAMALHGAVGLHDSCQADVVKRPPFGTNLLDIIKPFARADTRYEIEAALRTIPEVMPPVVKLRMYGVDKRLPPAVSIPPAPSIGMFAWADRLNAEFPEVVGEWHDWIWRSHSRYSDPCVRHMGRSDEILLPDYGGASVLTLAAARLSIALSTVLDTCSMPPPSS